MTQLSQDTFYLLDSYGLIYRSYFAFVNHPLTNRAGENVSALYGFFRSLASILSMYKPEYFLAAFDSRTPTFRHIWYPEYKATREKTPEDLHAQIPHIEKILNTLGIPCLRKDGFEADDIIATLARRAAQEKRQCVIISVDKDLMQLVGEFVSVLKPDKEEVLALFNAEKVKEHWGVMPEQMLDYLSLVGDSADNIPGIKGIGPKTAVKLLSTYGTLDAVYEQIDSIKGAVQKKLQADKEQVYFSRKLITLDEHVSIENSPEHYCCMPFHFAETAALLKEYELPNLAEWYRKAACRTKENEINGIAADLPSDRSPTLSGFMKDQTAALRKNTGEYRIMTEAVELAAVIAEAAAQGFAAFDCETTGINPLNDRLVGFSLSLKAGSGIYVPLKAPAAELGESLCTVMPFAAAKELLAQLWNIKELTLVLHNAKFDYHVLRTAGVFTHAECRLFDTMIAAWLLEPDTRSFSLENLAEAQLGLQGINYKDIVPKGATFAEVPLREAVNYAAEDADFTLQLYQLYKPALERAGLTKLFETLEMPLVPLLADMEAAGIFLKKDALTAFSQELELNLSKTEAKIYQLAGHPFNISSPKQLQEVLFTERKLPPSKKTKSGYSTDSSVLEELAGVDQIAAAILDYRACAKLKSGYADALPLLADERGRIHTSFIQTGTATGRLSSRDPNLQNIPIRGEEGRKIRKAFCAEQGYKLISADYAQIELVILAHFSRDEKLVTAFRQGIDVHAATAALIFNVPIENVLSDMRRIAKVINFGVMYGMSAFRLANQLQISRIEAADFITRYFITYSGVAAFMETLKYSAAEKGFVETLMGRRRYIRAITSKNKVERAAAERIAINTPIQGSAADIVKTAMLQVERALRKQGLNARLLLQVHDELILEVPDAEVAAVKALLKTEMENVGNLTVPLRVSIEAGTFWGDFH